MRVNDSQAYRKMDVTMERISCIMELREILLSFQTGFNLVNAAVVYAILESISGLEPSSVVTEPRYFNFFPTHRTLWDDRKFFPSRRVSHWWSTSTASIMDASHTGVRR